MEQQLGAGGAADDMYNYQFDIKNSNTNYLGGDIIQSNWQQIEQYDPLRGSLEQRLAANQNNSKMVRTSQQRSISKSRNPSYENGI